MEGIKEKVLGSVRYLQNNSFAYDFSVAILIEIAPLTIEEFEEKQAMGRLKLVVTVIDCEIPIHQLDLVELEIV